MTARFTLTEKQVRDLINATPPGYVPSVTVTFTPKDDDKKPVNPADLIDP